MIGEMVLNIVATSVVAMFEVLASSHEARIKLFDSQKVEEEEE